jgi:hypothetical protein
MHHHLHKMNADLKRYGEKAVCFGVIEIVPDLDELPEAETFWLREYRAGGWDLYNAEMRGKTHRDRKGAR